MVGPFVIIGDRYEEFQAKSGRKRVRRIALLDQAEHSLINTVDWEPSEQDLAKLPEPGKSKGKTLTLGVTNLRAAFGGRFAVTADLIANGTPAAP